MKMKKILVGILFVFSALSAQNKFYNYYSTGLDYIQKQDWQRAITEFRSAASLEFEDVQRKRTYGTRFIEYYPHREIGIALYMIGDTENAKKELELSLAYRSSDRGEEYFKRISGGLLPPKPVAKIETPKVEPKPVVKEKTVPIAAPVPVNPNVINPSPTSSILVVTKKYDPNKSTQVGSRLAIAVLPFEADRSGQQYKEGVSNEMINQLVGLQRFRVIERSAMEKIVSEQKIQASGVVDDKSAVKLGKIAGADALVLGSITVIDGKVKVSARLVDVETAETIIAQDAVSENSGHESVDRTVSNVATLLFNELPIIEGDVIKVDTDELFIDIGGSNGVRKGTKCVVFRQGESIKHPISGEILGRKVTRLGEIIVIQVQDKFATVKTIESEQDIKVGDKVIIK
ncbi:MAG: hypothetical protein KA247_04950 [Bacteroidetes bacterium]|nr:hypothetical protein [Bacteroidota bacterium]